MTISLHELEPGVWIVPELVTGVTSEWKMSGMAVIIHTIGGEVRVRVADEVDPEARAAEVVAWIDARRTEPLKVVQS